MTRSTRIRSSFARTIGLLALGLAASLHSAPACANALSSTDNLTGAITYIHDPAVIREGATTYVFSTDKNASQGGFIPIRCSANRVAFTDCGYVFSTLPSWIATAVPLATLVWAPDISYFGGKYHLYYAVSSFGSNVSAIGMATNTTLDQTSSSYKWVDHGSAVIASTSSSTYNAIDPNIVVAQDGTVWLNFGSFWSGIHQRQITASTGLAISGGSITSIAARASTVASDPIEGANEIYYNGYYYLFVNWDYCCTSPASSANYKIVVGRSTSPNGPFVDESGVEMTAGGGTVLLSGSSLYSAPGGQGAYIDASYGNIIVFHALDLSNSGVPVLFLKTLSFSNGWPVIGN